MLPRIFAKVNPKTGVAVYSIWIVCGLISIPAFFLNLEQITKVISVGNLMNYSFVSACGVALRFRDRDTQTTVRAPKEIYVWLYLASSFILSVVILNSKSINAFNIIFGVITLFLFIELCRAEQPNRPRTGHFSMPMVPFLPLIGI